MLWGEAVLHGHEDGVVPMDRLGQGADPAPAITLNHSAAVSVVDARTDAGPAPGLHDAHDDLCT